MKYRCECCNYDTELKTNLDKHMNTKRHKSITEPIKYECKYCGQNYKHRQSLSKHIKYNCMKNKDEDLKEFVRLLNVRLENQDKQLESQSKQIETQSKQIEKLMGKLEINGSFNTTNIQNNITLLAYEKTDTSHLTDDDYKKCIKKVNFCVKNLIEKIHFNPNKPENMNIYISNMKDKYLMVYDGTNWNLANKSDQLEKLYDDKEIMLEEWLETNKDVEMKEKFLRYLNNKETDECINMIKEEIKLMMYNKKQICIKTNTVNPIVNQIVNQGNQNH
jgi:hypothetical protein